MRTLVTGGSGQVGRALMRHAPPGVVVTPLDLDTLDIRDIDAVAAAVDTYEPDLIINTAAYTAVDQAESDHEAAFAANFEGARNIAVAAAGRACRLVHISTDFVFDGTQGSPYEPHAEPHPLSVYGRSKLDGEEAVRQQGGDDTVIVRTSWVYSHDGSNFVKTMLSLMKTRPRIAVVCDQIGCPTWADSLAAALWEIGTMPQPAGIVHWTDAGVASWYDFATAVQEEALQIGILDQSVDIEPIRTEDFPTPAARPPFSVLDTSTTRTQLETEQLHWREALRRMLRQLAGGQDA